MSPFFSMREIFYDSTGYTQYEFTDDELKFLHDEAADMLQSPEKYLDHAYNESLAGQLEKEFEVSDNTLKQLNDLLLPWCNAYFDIFPEKVSIIPHVNGGMKLTLNDAWINFQKKYEFNPFHIHSGVFSFVIWLEIPYTIEEEKLSPHARNSVPSAPSPGTFMFYFTKPDGAIGLVNIPADEKYRNHALLFPSSMPHSVNPFYTSDKHRISVSGNFTWTLA